MASMVKRIIALCLMVLILFSFTGCGMSVVRYYYRRNEIESITKKMMQCVVDRDVDGIYEYYDDDIKKNNEEELKEQIRQLFDYIDGNIVSYEKYSEGGGAGSNNYGVTELHTCMPGYQEVITDTEKKYEIVFYYNYINKEHPEFLGLNSIRIFDLNVEHDYVEAGRNKFSGK